MVAQRCGNARRVLVAADERDQLHRAPERAHVAGDIACAADAHLLALERDNRHRRFG